MQSTPHWFWIALLFLIAVLACVFCSARFVREHYIDVPSTTRIYYDAGLKTVVPGLAFKDLSMSISTNDLICTYFSDTARNNNCAAPLLDTVTWPADASENTCMMYDATVKARDVKDSMLTLYKAPCQFMKACKWLTFTRDAQLDNTSKTALFLFLNRTVFLRVPHSRLSRILGADNLSYTWPTASVPLSLSSVDNRAIDETPQDTPQLRDLIRASDGPLATPATLYYVRPILPTPQSRADCLTLSGKASVTRVASIAATLGNVWLVLYVTRDALVIQLQNGTNGTRYVNATLPRPPQTSTDLAASLRFVWNLTSSGTTIMTYDGQNVYLVTRALRLALPAPADVPADAQWAVPDLWGAYAQWSE